MHASTPALTAPGAATSSPPCAGPWPLRAAPAPMSSTGAHAHARCLPAARAGLAAVGRTAHQPPPCCSAAHRPARSRAPAPPPPPPAAGWVTHTDRARPRAQRGGGALRRPGRKQLLRPRRLGQQHAGGPRRRRRLPDLPARREHRRGLQLRAQPGAGLDVVRSRLARDLHVVRPRLARGLHMVRPAVCAARAAAVHQTKAPPGLARRTRGRCIHAACKRGGLRAPPAAQQPAAGRASAPRGPAAERWAPRARAARRATAPT